MICEKNGVFVASELVGFEGFLGLALCFVAFSINCLTEEYCTRDLL